MSRAKGQNRPTAPRGLVSVGYEIRNLETGECGYIAPSRLKLVRRAKSLLHDTTMADSLELCALGTINALQTAASGAIDTKGAKAIARALKGIPQELINASRFIRGGV